MDWTPKQIRLEMLRKDVSASGLSRQLEVTQSTLYKVIEGLSVSDRIRRAIAEAVGRDVREIWPSAYMSPGGPPRRGRPKAKQIH